MRLNVKSKEFNIIHIKMRRLFFFTVAVVGLMLMAGCHDRKAVKVMGMNDSVDVEADNDSTIYGVCGEGTSMHSLQLIADNGDTLDVFVDDEEPGVVQGGLLAGDRIALIAYKSADGEMVAQRVINLTSLLGKWTSIDKNFEIVEGGDVVNNVKAEVNPWTSWKIVNGKLLLNTDTFAIDNLGPDSLLLENYKGIYVFKRQQ